MALPASVQIVEVGPRDGLQNEKEIVPLDVKVELIKRLADSGLKVIEAGSFVSPKWVPQLADTSEVLAQLPHDTGVRFPVLVPNLKGLELALASHVKEVSLFITPSEKFSMKNTNCTVAESVVRAGEVLQVAKQHHLRVRVYLSCVLGCPYEGEITADKVADLAQVVHQMGADEISLGDTIGVGTPLKAAHMLEQVIKHVPVSRLAVHYHDTYGQALANIYASLQLGVAIIDSSVAGLGGCPYAKGATGNVATEDVVYMLNGMGIETGVDLSKLISAGRYITEQLGKQSASRVSRAL